jgi:hypothetical protein
MKLYAPVSIVNDFKGCDNVILRWLVEILPEPLSYYLIIENHDPHQPSQGELDVHYYVDELFTQKEFDMLQTYLLLPLPIPNRRTPRYTAQSMGGGVDCLMIYERPNYNLPFKVEAFYDLG